jgi:hypothetical protein
VYVSAAILLFVPIFPETVVHVQISSSGNFSDRVDSSSKSLVSRFVSQSYPHGNFTLNGNVTLNGNLVTKFSVHNVSAGEYVFVWQSFGTPSHGDYAVEAQLYELQVSEGWSVNIVRF